MSATQSLRFDTARDEADERFDVMIIGGGQAGLAMGYFLAQQSRHFVVLDGGARSERPGGPDGTR